MSGLTDPSPEPPAPAHLQAAAPPALQMWEICACLCIATEAGLRFVDDRARTEIRPTLTRFFLKLSGREDSLTVV